MNKPYKRKISAWERMLNWSPYSMVSMLTRIKGNVSEQMVYAEATSVLPLIVSYAYHKKTWKKRKAKNYSKIF